MDKKNPIMLYLLLVSCMLFTSCGDKRQDTSTAKAYVYEDYTHNAWEREKYLVALLDSLGVRYDIETIDGGAGIFTYPTTDKDGGSYGFIIHLQSMKGIKEVVICAVRTRYIYKEYWRFVHKGSNKMYSINISGKDQNDIEEVSGYFINMGTKDTIELSESELDYPLRLLRENEISLITGE